MTDHEWREEESRKRREWESEQTRLRQEFEYRQWRMNFAVSLFCWCVLGGCAVVWAYTVFRLWAAPLPQGE